ncbi:hypothetical protein CR513_10837, partial [Mucuna pruriens]
MGRTVGVRSQPESRSIRNHGHTTEGCMTLRDKIDELIQIPAIGGRSSHQGENKAKEGANPMSEENPDEVKSARGRHPGQTKPSRPTPSWLEEDILERPDASRPDESRL